MRILPVGGEKETGVTLKRADFDHDDDEEEEEESCRGGGGGEDIEAAKPIFLSSRQREWKERNEDKPERERESGAGLWINGSDGSASDPF